MLKCRPAYILSCKKGWIGGNLFAHDLDGIVIKKEIDGCQYIKLSTVVIQIVHDIPNHFQTQLTKIGSKVKFTFSIHKTSAIIQTKIISCDTRFLKLLRSGNPELTCSFIIIHHSTGIDNFQIRRFLFRHQEGGIDTGTVAGLRDCSGQFGSCICYRR